MSLTAIVTNHDYGRYLRRCIDSALTFGVDEIRVYDDGSTDDSLASLATYGDRIHVTHRDDASGSPIWGSNQGIVDCVTDHLIFLDADNYLLSAPPVLDVDYCFGPVAVVSNLETLRCTWEYPDWPLTPVGCFERFLASCGRGKPVMPFPWGGVWRTSFLAGKSWRRWPSTAFAADFRTALDWCLDSPTLSYHPQSFLAFRTHAGQWSASPERALMVSDAIAYASSLR